ncbi:MAG: hypothetical protein DRO23_04290 [Thermoprotei archaeon]|nr:MAG: hypothetical protein DRO23_04290 [Thermoprotei archaeon]
MPKVLVTEFISSIGPRSKGTVKSYWDLVVEGFSMAYTAAKVLKEAGADVYITLNSIFENISSPFKMIVVKDYEDYLGVLEKHASLVDYVILIAPPKELIELAKIVKDKVLGPTCNCIQLFSNKKNTFLFLKEHDVLVPKTVFLRKESTINVRYPVIVKPIDMAGSAGITLAKSHEQLKYAIDYAFQNTFLDEVAIQEYLVGIHASISVISNGQEIIFLSNNIQLINMDSRGHLKYYGGITPLKNKGLHKKSMDLVYKIVKICKGLKGYFGLDLVWVNWKPYIVEINPRLTTSFLGLAEIFGADLGKLMLYSVGEKVEAEAKVDVKNVGYAYYVISEKKREILSNERILSVGAAKKNIVLSKVPTISEAILRINKLRSYNRV